MLYQKNCKLSFYNRTAPRLFLPLRTGSQQQAGQHRTRQQVRHGPCQLFPQHCSTGAGGCREGAAVRAPFWLLLAAPAGTRASAAPRTVTATPPQPHRGRRPLLGPGARAAPAAPRCPPPPPPPPLRSRPAPRGTAGCMGT